jgi:hypothetical protein
MKRTKRLTRTAGLPRTVLPPAAQAPKAVSR